MHPSFFQELSLGARQAYRAIIPELKDRIPLTRSTAVYPLACYAPFIFMAYLSRRPDTHLVRLLLLPSVICSTLGAAYRYVWTDPALNVYNWGQCLLAAVVIAKSLEYAFHKEGMLKIGETRPGEMKGKGVPNGTVPQVTTPSRRFIAPWLYDAIEVAHSMRGLRWKYGRGVHIPKETRPLDRVPFLLATLPSFIINFLLLDTLESCIKLFPGVGAPTGGTMFYQSLPPLRRYAVSTLVHMLTGSSLLVGFGMMYSLVTLIAVGLLNSSPTSWPPVVDDPWSADSMHTFWSKHWHQLLRQTFLVLGGYPGRWIAGDLGMLFGAFIASGLFHECAMHSMGRGFDPVVLIFFALQGPILIGERMWRKITGHRVGGRIGRLWVYSILFIGAQPMVDAWHRRGLGGGMVIPPILSPVRLVLPAIQRMLQQTS